TASQSSSLRRMSRPSLVMPALLTRMSTPPNAVSTSATSFATAAASDTSQANPLAFLRAAAAASALAWSLPTTATLAPASDKRCAIALPMPRVLPVTSALLPERSILIVSFRAKRGICSSCGELQQCVHFSGGAAGHRLHGGCDLLHKADQYA